MMSSELLLDLLLKYPIASFVGVCDDTVSGNIVAAPPINEINSRRLIAGPHKAEQSTLSDKCFGRPLDGFKVFVAMHSQSPKWVHQQTSGP